MLVRMIHRRLHGPRQKQLATISNANRLRIRSQFVCYSFRSAEVDIGMPGHFKVSIACLTYVHKSSIVCLLRLHLFK